jgi:phosphoserine phosphatase
VQTNDMADAALRTLAVAYRPLSSTDAPGEGTAPDLEQGLILAGIVGMIDPPRDEATAAIAEARRAGLRVIMITGDHPRTAARIAADLGIVEAGAKALTGTELEALDGPGFEQAVRRTSVFARVAPAHKLRIISVLQADGNVVAMTGDGVNDAPALKQADIGVAMGVAGTAVAKEAATMVLTDDNFATIVTAVRHGRTLYDNILKFVRFQLSTTIGAILTVFGAALLGLPEPFTALQILWVAIIMDGPPAVSLALDEARPGIMDEPPRARPARAAAAARAACVCLRHHHDGGHLGRVVLRLAKRVARSRADDGLHHLCVVSALQRVQRPQRDGHGVQRAVFQQPHAVDLARRGLVFADRRHPLAACVTPVWHHRHGLGRLGNCGARRVVRADVGRSPQARLAWMALAAREACCGRLNPRLNQRPNQWPNQWLNQRSDASHVTVHPVDFCG